MSDNKPITQGLREYIERHPTMMHAVGLTDLCDGIDAVHKALEDENAELRKKLDGDSEVMAFVDRLSDAADRREDVDLWGVSYTALPLDADGVPIHVGDVVKGEKVGGGFCEPFEVVGYIMSNGELEPMDEYRCPRKRKYLHHNELTVDDVLREFVTEFNRDDTELCDDEIIERFAKRLQLAEGDAE